MENGSTNPTLYQILHVHPRAPIDLITGAYWRLTGKVQSMRGVSHAAEVALYHLTRAYETLADHAARKAYDEANGFVDQPVLPKLPPPPPKRRMFFGPQESEPAEEESGVDYYEVMRLDPEADSLIVPEAYTVMRNYYLRIAAQHEVRWELLDILEEARSIISDPELRRLYDDERAKKIQAAKVAAATPVEVVSVAEVKPKRAKRAAKEAKEPPAKTRKRQASEAPVQATAAATNGANTPVPADDKRKMETRPPLEIAASVESPPAPASTEPEPVRPAPDGEEDWGALRIAKLVAEISSDMVAGASQRVRQALDDRTEVEPIRAEEAEAALMTRFSSAPYPLSPTAYGMEASASLEIIDGPEAGRTFNVDRSSFTIGCAEYCDVTLPGLAPDQVRIQFSNGSFALYSLAEMPEVYVHGECVDWAVLANEDEIEIGPYTMRFNVAYSDEA